MFSIVILAFSLSTDAFAVSLARGAGLKDVEWHKIIKTAALFGIMEMLAPCLGWVLGVVIGNYIAVIDHWVAFILLAGLGIKMMREAITNKPLSPSAKKPETTFFILFLTALGTSIDAFVIGLTLALVEAPILLSAAIIGFTTFFMSLAGLVLGRFITSALGKIAEVAGGIILVGVGGHILLSHLGYL